MVVSPITGNSNVTFEYDIPVQYIIDGWKQGELKIDVSKTFKDLSKIEVYKCNETGLRFYAPANVAGDSRFYERLQETDWYYMPWKWEHQLTAQFIKPNDKVLEVGCGRGDFIKRIASENKVECVGLELNESVATEEGPVKIYNRYIEDYGSEHPGKFDLVCSFQVLEHIPSVGSFMEGQINALKEGGLLIIGVPNNDAFIKYNKMELLNMPPHHMGLWTEKSLRELAEYFNLKVKSFHFEPLQPHHYNYYFRLTSEHYFGEYVYSKVIRRMYKYGMKHLVTPYLKSRANRIKGHTILAVLQK